MNIAILLRGFHYFKRDRYGFPLDGRKYLDSFQREILSPLADHTARVYVATYPSPIADSLLAALQPHAKLLLNSENSNQLDTFNKGLDLIRADGFAFDRVLCTRFDLVYCKPVSQWKIWGGKNGIFFPWREYGDPELMRKEVPVGDTIHIIDRAYFDFFQTALTELRDAGQANMHGLYKKLQPVTPDLFFIEEESYDSNSLYFNKKNWNPLYRIANRPRLPIPAFYHPGGETSLLKSPRAQQLWLKVKQKVGDVLIRLASCLARAIFRAG